MYTKEQLIELLHISDQQVTASEKYVAAKEETAKYHRQIIDSLQVKLENTTKNESTIEAKLEPFQNLLQTDIDYLLDHMEGVLNLLISHSMEEEYSQGYLAPKLSVINQVRKALSEVARLSRQEATI